MSVLPEKSQTPDVARPWLDNRLAANGAPVRDNFKAWFRDSKILTPSKEPLVLFHGTASKFDAFSHSKIKSINEGLGFYFTDNRQVANGYGNALEVCLSLQNPMPYDRQRFSQPVLRKVIRRMAELQAVAEKAEIADGLLSNFGNVRSDGLAKVVAAAARMSADELDANDQIASFFGAGVNPEHILRAFHQVTGHDGITANGFSNCGEGDNRIYVAWFPEQIKSVVDNAGLFLIDSPEITDQAAARHLLLARQAASMVGASAAAAGPSRGKRASPSNRP